MLLIFVVTTAFAADWHGQYRHGLAFLDQGKVVEAQRELSAALRGAETSGGGSADVVSILDALARTEFQRGQYQTARKYLDRAVGFPGIQPGDRGNLLANAAQVYLAMGEISRAGRCSRQMLELLPENASAWQIRGKVLYLEHSYAEAESAQRKAIALAEKADFQVVGAAWNDLAAIYQAQKNYPEALAFQLRALELAQPGQSRARMLTNLAVLQWKLSRKHEAAGTFRQALTEMETAVGGDHPDVGRILEEYGEVLRLTGQKAEAREMAKRAEALRSASAVQSNSSAKVDWRALKP